MLILNRVNENLTELKVPDFTIQPKTRARSVRADYVAQMVTLLNKTAVRPFSFGQILGMTKKWRTDKMHAALAQAARARKPGGALWWMIKNGKLLGIS